MVGTGLKSSLFEPDGGEAIEDIVSTQIWQKCNDATVVSDSPLTIEMPRQRWAYGLILPFDRGHSRHRNIAVRLDLSVRGQGAIGVTAVDTSLTIFTAIEHVVAEGRSTIAIEIPKALGTHALLLRTLSSGARGPEVTIHNVSTFRPHGMRLAERRHNLNFDLFVILSMPKTATQTIEQTLLHAHPAAQVRRVHFVSADRMEFERVRAESLPSRARQSLLRQVDYGTVVRKEMTRVRAFGGSVAVLTGIREPVSQTVALLFEAMPALPEFAWPQKTSERLLELAKDRVMDALQKQLAHADDRFKNCDLECFFRTEFQPATGVDVLEVPLERDRGFALLANECGSVLLYRFEDIRSALAPGLAALTGLGSLDITSANRSEEKDYAEFYDIFRKTFRLPRDFCAAIYDNDRYVQHFYSAKEIDAFKAKWSGSTPR
jgi:hypothetical protein